MLPIIDLNNIIKVFIDKYDFDLRNEVRLTELYFIGGNVSLFELISLCTMVKMHNPYRILEIGTFIGRTTVNLIKNAPDASEIYTVDLPNKEEAELRLEVNKKEQRDETGYIGVPKVCIERSDYHDKIVQVSCDSAKLKQHEKVKGKSFDFIFIDASHSYEYAKNDTLTALDILIDGGVIMWHDYSGWPGVTQALNEVQEEHNLPLFHIKDSSLAIYFKNESIVNELMKGDV